MKTQQKAYKGLGMEGPIASWYAKLTGKNLTRFKQTAERIRQRLPDGGEVLEVAPGPGYMAIELARDTRFKVCGLDISASFIRIARENAERAGVPLELHRGDAAHMPLQSDRFDYATCTAAFKNFSDPIGALNELWRVIKPGGQASIIDLNCAASDEALERELADMKLSRWNNAVTELTFRHVLLKRAYSREQFQQMVAESRWKACEILEEGVGLEVLLRKPSLIQV
jgi:ubiquinone/menaquinone biosynthesis C-methylase UbiE